MRTLQFSLDLGFVSQIHLIKVRPHLFVLCAHKGHERHSMHAWRMRDICDQICEHIVKVKR